MPIRNLFDQYNQPENRLTHALLSCLEADRALLQRFVRWSVGRTVTGPRQDVYEQSLPGELSELPEGEQDRRGLPDGCFVDPTGWALLIENKFQSSVTADQIRRHRRTAARRGIEQCAVLVLSVKPVRLRLGAGVFFKLWPDVYVWLRRESRRSQWARICADYLEAAEAREAANGYLQEGTLTVFSGIPFGNDEPYTYLQAKRLLALLRDELKQDRRLQSRLGLDPSSRGRGAITGRSSNIVWDFIALKAAREAKQFTQFPHLTLGIRDDRLEAYVTIPNAVRPVFRNHLLGHDYEDFAGLISKVTDSLVKVVKAVPGSKPMVVVVQRHFATQRSRGTVDCALRFDPRTAIPTSAAYRARVKLQPQWLQAAYDVLKSRKSNLQFRIGVDFPYATCPTVATRKIIRACADVWLACAPVIRGADLVARR